VCHREDVELELQQRTLNFLLNLIRVEVKSETGGGGGAENSSLRVGDTFF
jgi:hypothetical protein